MLPRRSQQLSRIHAAIPDVSTPGLDILIVGGQASSAGAASPSIDTRDQRWTGRLLLGQLLLFDLVGQPRRTDR